MVNKVKMDAEHRNTIGQKKNHDNIDILHDFLK